MADDLISQYETQTQCNRVKLQGAIDDISNKIEKVRRHKDGVKHIIANTGDLAVVRESRKLEDVNEERKSCPELANIAFTLGEVKTSQMELMFKGKATAMDDVVSLQGAQAPTNFALSTNKGSDFVGTLIRQRSELILKSTAKYSGSNRVSRMCYGSYKKTWVKCRNENKITLIDRHGGIEKMVTFDSNIKGMTTANDGTLLLCRYDDKDIKQVTMPSGKVTSVFSTGKVNPLDIGTAPEGDIYVALVDTSNYNVTADSDRLLVRFSAQGKEKARVRHDKRGDALFVLPRRVMISNAGDFIGVINTTDKKNSHLVILNEDLTLQSRYLGNGKVVSGEDTFDTATYTPDTNYYINDAIFDSFDNIIICEAYSRCVQLVSRDCFPMRTLMQTSNSSPESLTMTGDEMWLAFKDGTVKIYEYA